MTTKQIEAVQRNGNLHIKLHGHFTPEAAGELTGVMVRTYTGKGNIFIHTAGLDSVDSSAGAVFSHCLGASTLPTGRVYLTGRKGLEIGPDKGKVIVYEKRNSGCCGRCPKHRCDSGLTPIT